MVVEHSKGNMTVSGASFVSEKSRSLPHTHFPCFQGLLVEGLAKRASWEICVKPVSNYKVELTGNNMLPSSHCTEETEAIQVE